MRIWTLCTISIVIYAEVQRGQHVPATSEYGAQIGIFRCIIIMGPEEPTLLCGKGRVFYWSDGVYHFPHYYVARERVFNGAMGYIIMSHSSL